MTTATRRKFRADPTKIYVSWQGFSTDLDGVPFTAPKGTRLRGDHPAVRKLGSACFVADGTPADQMPHVMDAAIEAGEGRGIEEAKAQAKAASKRPTIPPTTPVGDLMQCVQPITMSVAGTCNEGSVVLKSDARVKLAPIAFLPLLETMEVA